MPPDQIQINCNKNDAYEQFILESSDLKHNGHQWTKAYQIFRPSVFALNYLYWFDKIHAVKI